MKEIKVGLMGFGIVGTGTAKILIEDMDLISQKLSSRLTLARIADLDIETPRPVTVDPAILTTDAHEIIRDPEIDIVVETIGGTGIAKELILKAIHAGKHIVTANKALLAIHGQEIFEAADKYKVEVLFEAAVGGGIPIVRTLKEDLLANRFSHLYGILNGTANFILSKMAVGGVDFGSALKEAQAQGYAEADPTFDIEGIDTAHKLAILVSLAYGVRIDMDDIHIEGINGISPMDIQFAHELGYTIKLLALASSVDNKIEARVHPAMIPSGHILAGVSGPFNALLLNGHATGDILLYGAGAGMMASGSAVVSDVIEIARSIACDLKSRVPNLAWQEINKNKLILSPMEDVICKYYFRFSVKDQHGVLSRISGILSEFKISISSVIQKDRKINDAVSVVMMTHEAKEADVQAALDEIHDLDSVLSKTISLRVEDRF